MKFDQKTWFVWLMLFFLPPAGIFLMWKNKKYNKVVRIILSIVFVFWFIIYAAALTSGEQQNINSNNDKTVTESGNINSSNDNTQNAAQGTSAENSNQTTVSPEESINSNIVAEGELKVHFIDVGQADSILLQQGSSYMLVDAGNNADAQAVKNYLTSQGIKELQYFVGTHKDEDHIGSADYIVNSFKIGKVYFPKQTATTETFKNFVAAVKNKGLSLTVPKIGEQFKLGDAAITVLAPNSSSYEDANDYSIVLKVSFGGTSFILTGDAEAISEKEMVASGMDLSATVLKVGHHGSRTSTSQAFLNKVNPKYAVILVGKDNKYGHPTQEAMDRLKNKGVKVFRTDEQGTIVTVSNGKDVFFNAKTGSYKGIATWNSTGYGGSSGTGGSSSVNPADTENKAQYSNIAGSSGNSTNGSTKNTMPSKSGNGTGIVYWTPGGKSYHYIKDCSTLARSKDIEQGPLSGCPKSDPCDKCVH